MLTHLCSIYCDFYGYENDDFQINIVIFFVLLKQCAKIVGRTPSMRRYQQSMFQSKNKKTNVYPCKC